MVCVWLEADSCVCRSSGGCGFCCSVIVVEEESYWTV